VLSTCTTPAPSFIGLQILNGNGNKYFYYGTKSVLANRQTFSDFDFANKQFIEVTAEIDEARRQAGTKFDVLSVQPYHFGGRQRIGVKSVTGAESAPKSSNRYTDLGDAIRAGEALVLKLGTSLSTKRMYRASINIQGSGQAVIEFYNGTALRGTQTRTLTGNDNQVVVFVTTPENGFNTIKLKCASGEYGIKGFTESSFQLVEASGSTVRFAGMNWQNGSGNKYIFRSDVGTASTNRQQQIEEGGNLVNFNSASPSGKFWLNVQPNTGAKLSYFGGNFNFAVGSNFRLDAGESITWTPGADFGSTAFRVATFTQQSAGILRAETFLNAAKVGTFESVGTANTLFVVGNNSNFDRLVLTRVTGTPSLGVAGTTVRFYPACL
jgi:hypothetical protein